APPDYNFVADVAGASPAVAVSNAEALRQAIDACKGQGPTKLVIPKGTYRFAPAHTIAIENLTDLTLDGQGSVLILEDIPREGPSIYVGNCTRTLLENFTLDWDWTVKPIASLGTVSNLSPDKLQCDFTFPDLNATQTDLTRTTPWRGLDPMDPTHLICIGAGGVRLPKGTIIAAGSAGNILHVTLPTPVPLVDGQTYCIRHMYYDGGGFKVANSSDLTFNAVDIYSIPSMGFFFNGTMHNFQLTNCKILRAPGSRNPFTTAADGIHVDEFVDNLNIENCSITGCGDDAMNIHNECYEGEVVPDPTDSAMLTLLNCPSYQLRLSPGDPVEFDNADYSYLNNSTTPVTDQVATVSSVNKGIPQTVIHFAAPLPPGITAQSILRNAKFSSSNVRITGCDIIYSNGRGILLSAENALVSHCHIQDVRATAINLESQIVQPLWTEGRGAANVLIKNNVFENDNRLGRYYGAIIYTNADIPWGPTTATLYKQISIEDNQFINCPGPAMSLTDCSDVLVRSNVIKLTDPLAEANRYAGAIFITNSSDLALGGNTWVSSVATSSDYGVVYDPATISNLSTDTNAVTNTSSASK
ncbi:MAG TPA: right-handed parallel beta-helix repeat-containing protein, partial [Candidatus Methylacidiphilales bacterium]